MPSLNKAIEAQITDTLERDEEHFTTPLPPTTEIQSLLQAFVSLLNAYLQRVNDIPAKGESRVSDTFGTNA